MLVEMRTVTQAAKVATATGGVHLLVASTKDNEMRLGRRVDVGRDFEVHREAVESVSVLFKLYDHSDRYLVEVPSGWRVTAAKFEVEWPKDPSLVHSHFGARRFAYNWALARVKADIDAKKSDPTHESIPWTLPALRKEWNRVKNEAAPWWATNSKESYSSGISDLVTSLSNWSKSNHGVRKGRKVGFPRFKSVRRGDPGRVRFTTGTMRLEDDRRTIVLPTIGPLRSKENTRRLERPLSQGRAQILNITLSEQWGRLFVSVNYAIRTSTPRQASKLGIRAGVDLGLRTLATVADTDGKIIEFPNPAPLRDTLIERRKAGRQMSRRIPGSKGHRAVKAKLARLDRRAVNIRLDTYHKLTSQLVDTYSEVVIEDLDIAAMKRSMGRRAFRRSVCDAALGMFRPQVTYKMTWVGTTPTVADRWYPSSQIHHGCDCRLIGQTKMAKVLTCSITGEAIDRDINAAKNLRDWPDYASSGLVEASAPVDTQAIGIGGTDPGFDDGMTRRRRSDHKTRPQGKASRGEARTESREGRGTLQREVT